MTDKVYIINAKTWDVHARDRLGRSIASMSRANKEQIHFHTFKDDMLGGASILLECSDKFFNLVKARDDVGEAREMPADWPATERSAKVTSYFTAPPPPGRGPKLGM